MTTHVAVESANASDANALFHAIKDAIERGLAPAGAFAEFLLGVSDE